MATNYSFDGSGNGASESKVNAVGTSMVQIAPANYKEGTTKGLIDAPNARTISNEVVAGDGTLEGLPFAGMVYAWGQFVDHDINLSSSDGVNRIDITIPEGDEQFKAGSVIPVSRVVSGENGDSINGVTGWLDASMVYGSSAETAAKLRGDHGRLRTSEGDNLPISDGQFVAGEVRAAENPDLTALQTLMVREHNHWADHFAAKHPGWSSDQVYNEARSVVTAEMQKITYYDFLPLIVGKDKVTPYNGYQPNTDARMMEEFAASAFRFGHSIVSQNISSVTNTGEEHGVHDLADVFGNTPKVFAETGGTGGLIRHLAADVSQKFDPHIVEALRNFLNAPPAGQDLAAFNIQRGRDLGIANLNETRKAFGLAPYRSISEITDNPEVIKSLETVYGKGNVDQIELWIGGLSEDPVDGALVGETFQTIIAQQFKAMRDGDALWFENQSFDPEVQKALGDTTLSQIILRNTDTTIVQDDAFLFTDRHASDVMSEHPQSPQLVIGTDDNRAMILGGEKDDVLVAGLGRHQVMAGHEGADRFAFIGSGQDVVIADFHVGVDTIDFELTPADFGSLSFKPLGDGNTVIQIDDTKIALVGVSPNSLTKSDFVFNSDRNDLF